MDGDAKEQSRLAVLELVHAAHEQAPRDQAGDQREGDTVKRAQCGLVTRRQSAGEELDDDVAAPGVAVREEGEHRDAAGELGELVIAGDRGVEEIAPEHADHGHQYNPDQQHASGNRNYSRQPLQAGFDALA